MREGKGQEEGEKATEKEGGESRKRVIDRMKGGGYSWEVHVHVYIYTATYLHVHVVHCTCKVILVQW